MSIIIPKEHGVIAIGVKTKLHKPGESVLDFTLNSLRPYANSGAIDNHDIVCVTESIIARAQNNFININHIAEDFKKKIDYKEGERIGIISPIFSRNRYSMMLQAFARAASNIVLMLNYPRDEQGNQIMSDEQVLELNKNPYTDTISLSEYNSLKSRFIHPFTHLNYIDFYKSIFKKENCRAEIFLGNNPLSILSKTKKVLVSSVHSRFKDKKTLKKAKAEIVLGLDDLANEVTSFHGYNLEFGLLGSNISNPETEQLKLFPRDNDKYAIMIRDLIKKEFKKEVQVIIYADGAYKDPTSGIWELADPVVVAGSTPEISSMIPKELKLKYLVDKYYNNGLSDQEIKDTIKKEIKNKEADLDKKFKSQGTTPRLVKNLVGSLADLVSGSGDRCTPIVLIKGYFS